MCQDLVLRVENRVKILMWTKASVTGPAASRVTLNTRGVGLAGQQHLFSEMCMGKELGSNIEVRVLTVEFKYLLGSE